MDSFDGVDARSLHGRELMAANGVFAAVFVELKRLYAPLAAQIAAESEAVAFAKRQGFNSAEKLIAAALGGTLGEVRTLIDAGRAVLDAELLDAGDDEPDGDGDGDANANANADADANNDEGADQDRDQDRDQDSDQDRDQDSDLDDDLDRVLWDPTLTDAERAELVAMLQKARREAEEQRCEAERARCEAERARVEAERAAAVERERVRDQARRAALSPTARALEDGEITADAAALIRNTLASLEEAARTTGGGGVFVRPGTTTPARTADATTPGGDVFTRAANEVDEEFLARLLELEVTLVRRAKQLSLLDFRTACERAAGMFDANQARARAQRLTDGRTLSFTTQADGSIRVYGKLDPVRGLSSFLCKWLGQWVR